MASVGDSSDAIPNYLITCLYNWTKSIQLLLLQLENKQDKEKEMVKTISTPGAPLRSRPGSICSFCHV